MPEINKRGDSQSTGDEGVVGAMLVGAPAMMPMKSLGGAPSVMMPYRGKQHCKSCALIYELAAAALGNDKQAHHAAAIAQGESGG